MLTTFGLDEIAERVYRTLLLRPQGEIADIAPTIGLTAEQFRARLDQLSALGLLRGPSDDPAGLQVVSPEVSFEALLARQQAELAAQQQRIAESRAFAEQMIVEYANRPIATRPGEQLLVGIDEIRAEIARLTEGIKEEVMSFAPDGAQDAATLEASKPLDAEVLARGVRMRTVYLDSIRNNHPSVAYADWLAEAGGQIRTVPSLPIRMIIIDRSAAIIPVDGEDAGASAVVLRGHGTLAALCALFDRVWESGEPLGKAKPRDSRGLTAQEREALRLLSQGHTDEAIAKRLGVSPRTARRIAADVMELLGAKSRFQAGLLAAHRGWLPAGSV
ncbi:helix-turn-helix domain-containing protein [Streptomyces sp. ISL-36]|uniref:LuxR C-terminal-related transcriptional regulator n=1 Tax=Streptomyces sp. ISL-36 TaxID=2819182 RepID=UPI001BE560A0|nr:LuxR C-terminal-related transcriptional regulator [Streptomyces sp. ISL-36]MBT2440932.1 helix-turn-helix domain-containing protein [Streptomyces sp. ISL-36]